MIDVDVHVSSHLKEELAWAVGKRLWIISIRYVPIIGSAIISVANMLLFYYIGIGTVHLESRCCYRYIAHAKIFLFNTHQEVCN